MRACSVPAPFYPSPHYSATNNESDPDSSHSVGFIREVLHWWAPAPAPGACTGALPFLCLWQRTDLEARAAGAVRCGAKAAGAARVGRGCTSRISTLADGTAGY